MTQNKNEAVDKEKLNKWKLVAKIICGLLSLIAVGLLIGLVYHMVTTISIANNVKILQEIALVLAYLIGFVAPLIYLGIAEDQISYQEWLGLTTRFVIAYVLSIISLFMICMCIPLIFTAISIK